MNDLRHKKLASKHFLRDNLNLFGAKKVIVENLLVSEKLLGGKFLLSDIILDSKILCLSMSSDKTATATTRIDNTPNIYITGFNSPKKTKNVICTETLFCSGRSSIQSHKSIHLLFNESILYCPFLDRCFAHRSTVQQTVP